MNRDDIIRMAREAGMFESGPLSQEGESRFYPHDFAERFAALIAAHEREACARVVENYTGAWDDEGYALTQAIRARGEA
jgi:hypothetical protein